MNKSNERMLAAFRESLDVTKPDASEVIYKICQKCGTHWSGIDTPNNCPSCGTDIIDWHGLYLGMDILCSQQQQRAAVSRELALREAEKVCQEWAAKLSYGAGYACNQCADAIAALPRDADAQRVIEDAELIRLVRKLRLQLTTPDWTKDLWQATYGQSNIYAIAQDIGDAIRGCVAAIDRKRKA